MEMEKIQKLFFWGEVALGVLVYGFFVLLVMMLTDAQINEARTWIGASVCWIFSQILYRLFLRAVLNVSRKTPGL